MKKKLTIVLAVAMLLVSIAGQAMAYFEEGNLIRVVYDRNAVTQGKGTYEVVTDLGAGYNVTSATSQKVVLDSNNFSLSQLGLSDWSNVYVAYFTLTQANPTTGALNNLWLSGNSTTGPTSSSLAFTTTNGIYKLVKAANLQSGNAQNVNLQSISTSYTSKFGTVGLLSAFLPTNTDAAKRADKNLSALSTVGYVDQWLYYYATPNSAKVGTSVMQIRTYANGTTVINPNAVPVPAAAYLLGTGLLALVGIRRKSDETEA